MPIRIVTAIVLMLSILSGLTTAETAQLEEESVRHTWSASEGLLVVAELEPSVVEAGTWVLTVLCKRFEDGLFAWQLHISDTLDSVLVLPNDFLTARHFTTSQLGVSVQSDASQGRLTLRVPSDTPIPQLVVPGDIVELHALWIQQAPIATFTVHPDPSSVAITDPVGGGGAIVSSSSVLPDRHTFVQGDILTHQFVLTQEPESAPWDRLVLSYTIMRLPPNAPPQFVRFSHISYHEDVGSYSYEIHTASLAPGKYRLIIGGTNVQLTERTEFEVLAPESAQ